MQYYQQFHTQLRTVEPARTGKRKSSLSWVSAPRHYIAWHVVSSNVSLQPSDFVVVLGHRHWWDWVEDYVLDVQYREYWVFRQSKRSSIYVQHSQHSVYRTNGPATGQRGSDCTRWCWQGFVFLSSCVHENIAVFPHRTNSDWMSRFTTRFDATFPALDGRFPLLTVFSFPSFTFPLCFF